MIGPGPLFAFVWDGFAFLGLGVTIYYGLGLALGWWR